MTITTKTNGEFSSSGGFTISVLLVADRLFVDKLVLVVILAKVSFLLGSLVVGRDGLDGILQLILDLADPEKGSSIYTTSMQVSLLICNAEEVHLTGSNSLKSTRESSCCSLFLVLWPLLLLLV